MMKPPLLSDNNESQIPLNLENQIENVDISMNSDDEEEQDSDSDCTQWDQSFSIRGL